MIIETSGDPWSVRVLYIFVGAVISGLVGWISSLYNHYRDSRKHHLEELKQHILEPLRLATLDSAVLPSFQVGFGLQKYNPDAKVSEHPATHGPVLLTQEPETGLDRIGENALLQDARQNHYVSLVASYEKFGRFVARHSQSRRQLIEDLATEILRFSGLPAHPAGDHRGPYVMQLQLAMFVYGRLMEFGEAALTIEQDQDLTCLVGEGLAKWATGRPDQIRALTKKIGDLVDANRHRASELRSELSSLLKEQNALAATLSYEIAAKRLPGRCDLVPFWQM